MDPKPPLNDYQVKVTSITGETRTFPTVDLTFRTRLCVTTAICRLHYLPYMSCHGYGAFPLRYIVTNGVAAVTLYKEITELMDTDSLPQHDRASGEYEVRETELDYLNPLSFSLDSRLEFAGTNCW